MKKYILLACLILSSVFTFSNAEALYTITDVGQGAAAYALNDSGQVVGGSSEGAFLYDDGVMIDLGGLAEAPSVACDINNNGQVVGYYSSADTMLDPPSTAFLYDNGVMFELEGLGEGHIARAYGINDSGQIVGVGSIDAYDHHIYPFGWNDFDGDGVLEEDDTFMLSSGGDGIAYNINNSGQFVGTCIGGAYTCHIFGQVQGSLSNVSGASTAKDINNSGQIVGWQEVVLGYPQAFLYDDGQIIDLRVSGETSSYAQGINDSGQVVGYNRLPAFSREHAFLYDDGQVIDLNDLISPQSGWELLKAYDINSSGQIAGYGIIDEQIHAFLMTPVPEPATLCLLGLGVLLIRKKK